MAGLSGISRPTVGGFNSRPLCSGMVLQLTMSGSESVQSHESTKRYIQAAGWLVVARHYLANKVNNMFTLSPQTIAKIRQVEHRISSLWDEIIKIRTPTRSLVGGADFELELEAHISAAFVMALNKGATPESAANTSKAIGEAFVREWNRNAARQRVTIASKHEVQRWSKAGDKYAERLQREFEQISPLPV